ncbi:DUF2441 domain-containing protein [Paenibacillus sp. LS1]|uniref:DUF2441 domain-containing protein n=1 Tax=Paenibacillus sp. LS1 TaxID=2992120 RepID=UPI00222EA803|nr:DUF2441 domain-containing protein [Paenibacillus sp. LS1]MCW3793776.1 DUF2441 domain-containing protein [Paenibacillus sp. LS1]
MKIVYNERYFHIQRNKSWGESDHWDIGSTIKIGDRHNKLMKERYLTDYKMPTQIDLEKLHLDASVNPFYLRNIGIVYHEYIIKTREYIFENERLLINPDLPSRFTCLFLTDIDGIEFWKQRLLNNPDQQPYTIYEISVSGRIHKANQHYVELNTRSQEYNHQSAREYWSGVDADKEGSEYLFVGDMLVKNREDFNVGREYKEIIR